MATVIGIALPAELAFTWPLSATACWTYAELKVAFLESGAEWIFYMVSRMDHYLPLDGGAH